jgi:hypothetical protein
MGPQRKQVAEKYKIEEVRKHSAEIKVTAKHFEKALEKIKRSGRDGKDLQIRLTVNLSILFKGLWHCHRLEFGSVDGLFSMLILENVRSDQIFCKAQIGRI